MITVKDEHNVTVTRLLPSTKLAGCLKVFCYLYCITMLYMSFIAIFMSLDCFLTLHLSRACYSHFVSSAWTKSQEQRVIWCLGEFLQTAIALPINNSPSSLFGRNLYSCACTTDFESPACFRFSCATDLVLDFPFNRFANWPN